MRIHIEIKRDDLVKLITRHINDVIDGVHIDPQHVRIEVKSKQNYKAEWEVADFRAIYEANTGG